MDDKLYQLRHTAAHALAQAVVEMYPEVKLAIGPATEDGFYYDFDLGEKTFSPQDLLKLEKRIRQIIKENQKLEHAEVPAKEMLAELKRQHQPYKVELAEDLIKEGHKTLGKSDMVKQNGDIAFTDLCGRPHVKQTKEIGAVALLKIAGAYWRGDEKNTMLQRIYGTAFETQKELDEYLEMLKLAEERDHRKLGQELQLFVFSELVGPGMPLYTPRGAYIRQQIVNYSNELQAKIGYQQVHSPNMNKAELFKISGHYDKYKDDMLEVKSHYTEEQYYLKPMNCPQHTQIYASQTRSYRDLPIRFADSATLYRDEKPGELSGLTRLRAFSQDDGHCFCREDQIEEEFVAVLDAIKTAMKTYEMKYSVRLSIRDKNDLDKYIGDAASWDKAEKLLESILKKYKVEYEMGEGEAAFYGPKMDIMARDALNRKWQISTIQIDFSMPQRFKLTYVDKDGAEKTPVMIHRALVGSPERFMAILIEHYGGAFPAWLAPTQVIVASVSDKFNNAAAEYVSQLQQAGLRVEFDDSNDTVGKKVRNAEKLKVPYVLVFGEKEADGDKVAVRMKGQKEMQEIDKKEFIEKVQKELTERV